MTRWSVASVLVVILSLVAASQSTRSFLNRLSTLPPSFPTRDPTSFLHSLNKELKTRDAQAVVQKFNLMKETPHGFYRATAALFYHDIAPIAVLKDCPVLKLHGDLHLENMQARNNGNGDAIFDLADFDESFDGPVCWDVARIVTSAMLSMRETGKEKIDQQEADKLIGDFLDSYIEKVGSLSKDEWEKPVPKKALSEKVLKAVEEVENAKQKDLVDKETKDGKFIQGGSYKELKKDVRDDVEKAFKQYTKSQKKVDADAFTIKDIVSKLAGVGSLGRHRFNILADIKGLKNDRILEMKEAITPAAYAYYKGPAVNHAKRIVDAWNYFVPNGDPLMGVTKVQNVDAFVRELGPKGKMDLAKINKKKEFAEFFETVALVVARGHARSGKGKAVAQAVKSKKPMLVAFAKIYADQAGRDHQHFSKNA